MSASHMFWFQVIARRAASSAQREVGAAAAELRLATGLRRRARDLAKTTYLQAGLIAPSEQACQWSWLD